MQQAANALEFMRVDAEVVDRNVIRLDTDNVLDVVLTPCGQAHRCLEAHDAWSGMGSRSEQRVNDGALRLTRARLQAGGAAQDTGAAGRYRRISRTRRLRWSSVPRRAMPAMRELVASEGARGSSTPGASGRNSSRVCSRTPRSPMRRSRSIRCCSSAARTRTRSTAKLASKLPLKVSADRGSWMAMRSQAKDAAMQMIYPNPRNAQRYVWVFAAKSTGRDAVRDGHAVPVGEWDYIIDDGHIPAPDSSCPWSAERRGRHFRHNWRFQCRLPAEGDAAARAGESRAGQAGQGDQTTAAALDRTRERYKLRPGRHRRDQPQGRNSLREGR